MQIPTSRRPSNQREVQWIRVREGDPGYPLKRAPFDPTNFPSAAIVCVDGRGKFWLDEQGSLVYAQTRYGSQSRNPDLMNPHPRAQYDVFPGLKQQRLGMHFRHSFYTDGLGRTEFAEAHNLRIPPKGGQGYRFNAQMPSIKRTHIQKGHILSAQLGSGMEAINIVGMPSAVNQGLTIEETERRGLLEVAAVKTLEGDLNQKGEFYNPNYRAMEREVVDFIERGFRVGMHVWPVTFDSEGGVVTDVLYADVLVDGRALRHYVIDSEVD